MSEDPLLQPGSVIAGKYVVERKLGAGGMGVVLAVRHRDLGELYALKLMQPVAAQSAAARERFAREAKSAAKLKSDHVARAIDFGFLPDDGPPYMVLELLSGENMAERLARLGPLEPLTIAKLMLQACDALREAHSEGIVHRDLKPSNLFLTQRPNGSESLKVLDFGIAKTGAAEAGALTKTSTTMGSPFYMSPEQMRSAKSADPRSDIWSLGVTMFELATGRVPFFGESVTEVAIMVIECAVPRPSEHRPDLHAGFEQIVMRCLEKKPERRYAHIDELALALAAFVGVEWSVQQGARSTTGGARPADPAFAQTERDAATPMSAPDATVPAGPALTMLRAESRDEESSAPLVATDAGVAAGRAAPELARTASRGSSRRWVGLAGAGVAAVAALSVWGLSSKPAAPDASLERATEAVERAGAEVVEETHELLDDVKRKAPFFSGAGSAAAASSGTALPNDSWRQAVDAVVRQHKKATQGCYDLARKSVPGLKGKVTLRLTVRTDGTPRDVAAYGDGFPEAVKTCFVGVFSQMVFPKPDGGNEVSLVYPLDFAADPSGPKAAAASPGGYTSKPGPLPKQKKEPAVQVQQSYEAPPRPQ